MAIGLGSLSFLYPVMANGIRTGDPRGFNKGHSSKFCVGSRVRQSPEEGQRAYRPKRCANNNKDEDNSLKTLNDKNHQASSQKFRQLLFSGLTKTQEFQNFLFIESLSYANVLLVYYTVSIRY